MTASFKYLDTNPTAVPDAAGTLAPHFRDEFCFTAANSMVVEPVLFRSRRREEHLRKAAQKAKDAPEYLPSYQWFSRVTGFHSHVERPSIGFAVRARASAKMQQDRRVF